MRKRGHDSRFEVCARELCEAICERSFKRVVREEVCEKYERDVREEM